MIKNIGKAFQIFLKDETDMIVCKGKKNRKKSVLQLIEKEEKF